MAEIRIRRGRRVEWIAANPVLASGEPGLDTTTGLVKYGDGFTPWNQLPYSGQNPADAAALDEHVHSETPHPAYDDTTSFVLLYENSKV